MLCANMSISVEVRCMEIGENPKQVRENLRNLGWPHSEKSEGHQEEGLTTRERLPVKRRRITCSFYSQVRNSFRH